MNKNKFSIQDEEYNFPYHYLIDLDKYSNFKRITWGIEYFSYLTFVIKKTTEQNYSNFLDIGCGDGRLINILSNQNTAKHYYGYDLSNTAIMLAKAMNTSNKNAYFICDDFINSEYVFDLITLVEVLEHIPPENINQFIKKIYSKLSTSGKIIISVPTDNYPKIEKHYKHFNVDLIKNLFSDFVLLETKYVYKFTLLNRAIIAIISRFSFLNDIEYLFAKYFMFNASEKNAKHMVCILKKK